MTKQEFWVLVGGMVECFHILNLGCKNCPVYRMDGKEFCLGGKCGEELQKVYERLEREE
jgi:hypothetical protein